MGACGGSGEPADAHNTPRKAGTANSGSATPQPARNSLACDQATRAVQAYDQVSANHADDPGLRYFTYQSLAKQLTPIANYADGDVRQVLTAIVSLLGKAGAVSASDPDAERAFVDKTDPEFQKLRDDLARACRTA